MVECDARNTFCPEAVNQTRTVDGMFHMRSVKLFAGKTDETRLDTLANGIRWSIGQLGKCYDRALH
jgi:hypothetical protein